MNLKEQSRQRTRWFERDRFGMFIHWGLYAIPARGEWVRSTEQIPVENYQQYFDEFNPVDYDPRAWAAAAKNAGMQYVVMTAKHHDGFCLFDSQLTDYKSTNTRCGRDLIAEYLAAFREAGLKVGIYYSIIDWHHPDYPHFDDRIHPMRGNEAFRHETDFDRYLDYMHGQVREICTNYGKLDILWFDFSYANLVGEAWRATELTNMIRSLQPTVIIDNRLEASGEGFGSLTTENPNVYSGDFVSPEQIIPPDGILDTQGNPVTWEACITMNNNWGYCETDHVYKSAELIIRKLVECVSKNGNMLLNVGPDARGNIPPQSLETLAQIGRWMRLNGESIYGCCKAQLPKPDNGRYTARGNTLYAHITEGAIGPIPLQGIRPGSIRKARLLSTGAELTVSSSWTVSNYPDTVFIPLGPNGVYTYPLPDPMDTVIALELTD